MSANPGLFNLLLTLLIIGVIWNKNSEHP